MAPDSRHEERADPMLPIAEAIADDRPVDWNAELTQTPDQTSRLSQLRVVQTMAALHREAGKQARAEPGVDAGPAGETPLFTWGPLRVLELLGTGTFGEVYRAWDPALQREEALKLRRAPESEEEPSARRWLDEARRLARVRHPNVLDVHGADVHDGRVGIWTELIRGESLEQRIENHGRMSADEATLIGLELCRALAAVHAVGLVHGDVKASNVMREGVLKRSDRTPSGRIVLMDFGAAHDGALSTNDPTSFGTPLSAAPEVLAGNAATPSADLYSLGVLLHRLVTGRYPVEASSLEELMAKLESERSARSTGASLRALRPDLPTAFVQVVQRALALAPADRYRDAGEMESALAAVLGSGIAARPARSASRIAPVLVGVAALVLALSAGFLLTRSRTDRVSTARPGSVSVSPPVAGQPAPIAESPPGAGSATNAPSHSPPAATPPGALTANATMLRTTHGSHEALSDGGHITLGDQLALELDTTEPVYAYVLNEDDQGHLYALFPVAGVDQTNPLASGRHRLPGSKTGKDLDWQVTSVGGHERFLIVASRKPLANLEHRIAAVAPARAGEPLRYPELDPSALGSLRGLGGLVASDPSTTPGSGGTLAALARGSRRAASSDAIWIRFIELASSPR